MHHADYIAHHAMRVTRNPNDAYCNVARRTLAQLDAKRTMRRRIVVVLALVDAVCVALAFASAL